MKIGIMTFWWSEDNYGQLLQCYALQKYLRDQGHDPFLIRYDPRNDYAPTPLYRKLLKALNPVKLAGYLSFQRRKYLSSKEYTVHNRQFSAFRDTYLRQSERIYYSYDELKANPPQADCYIVGSDQVWNFWGVKLSKCKNLVHAYFLDFGKAETKRIAYAASWGKKELSEDFVTEISPLLARFNYISVREKSGIEICKQCGIGNVTVRCDPTLLLSAEQYRLLYQIEATENHIKKYVFVYRLSNPCDFPMKSLLEWAQKRQLEVVYVTANGLYDSYEKTYPTITLWLSLIDHAEYVITNSFHCCVFSLIFKKKFGVVPLNKSCSGMNSRIETLSELFGIKPRWIKQNDFSVLDDPVNCMMSEYSQFDISELVNE